MNSVVDTEKILNMNIDHSKFCIVPFVQLNTRGKGDARVCCSIYGTDYGIPKNLTLDEINDETYHADTEVYNLSTDKIEELWNSNFMKDFRMKMLNGKHIPNCEFCHRMEQGGFGSKRTGKNKKFLEKISPMLQNYYDMNGYVDAMPQWWEIRLSTKCNLSCVMCSPNQSSKMFKEYTKWENNITNQMRGSLNIARNSGEEYLSKSSFFLNQIKQNLKNVIYMEFRGGEVFADIDSVKFINEIAETEFAKNISLDISTNATRIDKKIINILNKFKGGLLRLSIDSFGYKDELIRYHTNRDHVLLSLDNSRSLLDSWKITTQTCIQSLNCIGIVDLLYFLDEYCKKTKFNNFKLGFTSVRGKEWLRHELVPTKIRRTEIIKIKQFADNSWLCNKKENIIAIEGLIKALQAKEYSNNQLKAKAKEYYDKLCELRNVNYWNIFKHMEFLNGS